MLATIRETPRIPGFGLLESRLQCAADMNTAKHVYVLRSVPNPDRHYVGATSSLGTSLAQHNAGELLQTARHRPWRVVVVICFEQADRARAFEKYLKSDSGRALTRRYFA